MKSQRHLVFGAGLIGGYVAGGLLAAGFNTGLVGRAKVRTALASGLHISDYLGNSESLKPPHFVESDNPQNLEFDFLWLTVKCTAIASVIEELESYVCANTVILCCQNGVGSDAPVKLAFTNNIVLCAVVGFNVAESSLGHLHRSTEGKLVIESINQIESMVDKLNSNLLPAATSNNIVSQQWAKLQLNLANPVNALADIPIKKMTEDADFRKIIAALMSELLAVCETMQLGLAKVTAVPAHWIPRIMLSPNWIFKLLAQKVLAIDSTAMSSMWWDLSAGRKTEIDFLNGAVVRQGERLGVDCPVNRRIVELVHQVETGNQTIGFDATALAEKLLDAH